MTKNPDWNSALSENNDFDIAMSSSEVFRNFAKMAINKEGVFAEDDEDECEEGVKQPLKQNKDYMETKSYEDYLDLLIIKAEAEADEDEIEDEVVDIDEEVIDTDSDGELDQDFGLDIKSPVSSSSNEYETGAGDSKYLDIGLSDKTMNDMKNDGVMSETYSAVKEVMNTYNEEELSEAEDDLGLNSNAAYVFGKGKEI